MFTIQQIKDGLLLNNSIIFTNIPTSIDVETQYYSNPRNFIKINNESTKTYKFENQLKHVLNSYSGRIVTKKDSYYFQLLCNSYSIKEIEFGITIDSNVIHAQVDKETNELINSFIKTIYPIFPYGGLNTYYCRHANTHTLYKSTYSLSRIIVGGLICEHEIMLVPEHKSFSILKSTLCEEYKNIILQLLSINSDEIKNKFYKCDAISEDTILF